MKIALVISVIIALFIAPPCYAGSIEEFSMVIAEEKREMGRPEMIVENATSIVVIFALEHSMREFTFNKIDQSWSVNEIRKFEDSTKSVWHKEPFERLQDGVNSYGTTN